LLKVLVVIAPLSLFCIFGFSKWKKHYGGGTWLGYVYRYGSGKRATDDSAGVFAAKVVFFLRLVCVLNKCSFLKESSKWFQ